MAWCHTLNPSTLEAEVGGFKAPLTLVEPLSLTRQMYGLDRTVIHRTFTLPVGDVGKNTVWNEIIHESELRCNGDLGVYNLLRLEKLNPEI